MDDKNLIDNKGMKSFNKMTAYSSQFEYKGFCNGIYDPESAWTMNQDWIAILQSAKKLYLAIPETYQQSLNCEKIINSMLKWNNRLRKI